MKSRNYYRRKIRNNQKETVHEQYESLKARNRKLEKENRELKSQIRTLDVAFKKTINKLEQYQELKSLEEIIKEAEYGEKETDKETQDD